MATGSIGSCLEELRNLLLHLKPTGDDGFEGLLAMTLSEFSNLTIRLAKSGSQFGRDGRSPSAPFAIAMEAKLYTGGLGLEVLVKGAVASHVLGDSIDVWAVGATSAIGDETYEEVTGLLEDHGVTFLAFDWAPRPLPPMAVLLAATKSISIDWLANGAHCDRATLATILNAITAHPSYDAQIERLRDDVTAAKVGLGALRMRCEEWLTERLRDPLLSQIAFGQYFTVADPRWPAVPRPVLLDRLAQRTALIPTSDRPVVTAVLGPDGVGKSWLVAQWWTGLSERPIMVIVAGRRVEQLSPNEPLEGLAHLLSDQVPCSSIDPVAGWVRRLRRWKKQNSIGHLRFVIAVDGLNQRPTRPWADLIKGLASEAHSLGGLVIVTSRNGYWERDIRPRLSGSLDIRTMPVDEFDDKELAAALAPTGASPHALPPKVREFVRNPRVCAVAVTLLDRLLLQPGELTVDRLLFEYWRQRMEERGDLTKHTIPDFEKLIRSHARAWLVRPSRSFERDEWDVPFPADIEIRVVASEQAIPGRYSVNDKSEDSASPDLRSFVADINNPEMARRRFSERQGVINERAAVYIREISSRNMVEIGEQPSPWGLKEVLGLDPGRIASWLQRILAEEDPKVLRQICNLAVSLAKVYSGCDPMLSSKVFRHLVDCRPIVNVQVEPEEIPLYEHALFSSETSEALESLKIRVFAQALNDSDLQMATVVAEVCGAHEWLDRYVQGLLDSWHPANQARGLTILGFRQPNTASERILSGAAEPGFLGRAKQFAFRNYRRAAWTRHWLECLERANDPIDFWRYGTLAETICDSRFLRVFPKATASDLLHMFGTDLYRRMKKKAEERSKKLRQTLFGLKAPEAEIAAAISDWKPSGK